jgi:type IV pilus assembly protein PilC
MAARIRLSGKERLSLFSDMSTMLAAGIPLLEAVESLESDAKNNLKKVLDELHRSLNNGHSLSHGMKRLPYAFDTITINLVRAAEAGGTLEDTLRDIVSTTKKELAFSSQLRTTMIYPVFVMFVFMSIILLMLTFVVPRVSKVFSTLPVHLSWITRVMFASSAFFLRHWLLVIGGIAVFFVIAGILVVRNKRAIMGMILSLPVLKVLGRNIDFTRLTRSLGLLMNAGLPVDEALILSERIVQKKQIIAVVKQMQLSVQAGKPLSTGLRDFHGLVPPIMSRSLETAERSGTLDKTLQDLTEYFDEQVAESLKVIGSLIEPILLIVVGVLVGILMITIIGPIYGLISQISPTS